MCSALGYDDRQEDFPISDRSFLVLNNMQKVLYHILSHTSELRKGKSYKNPVRFSLRHIRLGPAIHTQPFQTHTHH